MNIKEQAEKELWACQRGLSPYKGGFPGGFLQRCNARWNIERRRVLFPFGGATPERDNWIINDIKKGEPTGPEDEILDVDTGYDACDLPDEWEDEFEIVLSDPPYGEAYSENLYDVEYPQPSHHFREAARVCQPGGYVLILDQLVYMLNWTYDEHPVDRKEIIGVTTGPGMRIRALNVFKKPGELREIDAMDW